MKLEIYYEEINTKTTFAFIAYQCETITRGKFKDTDLFVYSSIYPFYDYENDVLFICGTDFTKDFNYFLIPNSKVGKLKNKVAKFNKKYKNLEKEGDLNINHIQECSNNI